MYMYRIIDELTGDTLANSIPDLAQAQELLELLTLDHPECTLAIEKY
jgi:hypothetical protein